MSDTFSVVILIITGLATAINVISVASRIIYKKKRTEYMTMKYKENLEALQKIMSDMQNEQVEFGKEQIEELEKLVKQLDDNVEDAKKKVI